MSAGIIQLTKEGLKEHKDEYDRLLRERPQAVETLKTARELGDLSENGFYKASRAKLSSIDSRLMHLKSLLKQAKVVTVITSDKISLGCNIEISDGNNIFKYLIVSKYESNPSKGKISNVSPIGKALLGRKKGETIEVLTPLGATEYRIVNIYV